MATEILGIHDIYPFVACQKQPGLSTIVRCSCVHPPSTQLPSARILHQEPLFTKNHDNCQPQNKSVNGGDSVPTKLHPITDALAFGLCDSTFGFAQDLRPTDNAHAEHTTYKGRLFRAAPCQSHIGAINSYCYAVR